MNDNKHPDEKRAGVRLDWGSTAPAGTTQSVKHGDVPSIEITLRQAEALVEVFGGHDAEVSIIRRPDVWPHLDLGLYAYFTEYPGEGTFYLGPTDVDDDLAANGRAPSAPIRTWRERIGQFPDFPLHAPTDVERAMEAEIAELRAQVAPPAAGQAQEDATAEMLDMLGRIEPLAMHDKKDRDQWFERLCRARAVQQPLPVPDQAVVVWRSDLVRAVAELIQLRAYRELVRAERDRKDMASAQAVSEASILKFQQRVEPWMAACFGPRISADTSERNHRFFEEATELAQAGGMPKADALMLVDYVYGRPAGELGQEVGGVMVTLAALCLAQGMDMHDAGETELARIWTKVDAIRVKQASKPKGSPLPVSQEGTAS